MNIRYAFALLLCATLFTQLAAQPAKSTKGTTAATKNTYTGPSAAGDEKLDKGDFSGALAAYGPEIAKIDAEAKSLVKLRMDYVKMSEYEKALQDASQINSAKTDWAKLYYGRAMANAGLGKKGESKPDLDIAIALDPGMADAYYQRAMLNTSAENRDNACMDISRAASMGHVKAKSAFDDNFCWNQANIHVKNGESSLRMRKYDEALREFDIAVALCPDSGKFLTRRGQAHLGLGHKTQALEDFNKATLIAPKSPDAFYQLGLYYFGLDNHDKAFDYFTSAINNDPRNYDAYMYRAQCCERRNQLTSAIYDYGMAVSLRPDDPEAYYRRGMIEREMKDMMNACKDFSRAAGMNHADAAEYLKECRN
ncbi:MAG: tetratricopeptide repeat protein [Bacteroidia bacterium]|jgi:tetratricopeptide (TPR) repeat protein|nr:tetratricopeptide repeat protein [Bacteroidia bacterium]